MLQSQFLVMTDPSLAHLPERRTVSSNLRNSVSENVTHLQVLVLKANGRA
jgi:hypothetical protein